MKAVILFIFLIGIPAFADDILISPVEGTVPVNCGDSAVPGTTCPNPYSSTVCLTCDSQVRDASPVATGTEGTK